MGYAALARLWLFESTKSRCARCSGARPARPPPPPPPGAPGGRRAPPPPGREEMIRLGFIWEWGFCVGWSGISLSLGGNMPVWMDWMGVWYAISTGKNKIGKRCLSNNLSVCLAVMFLYTSRSNNL